MSRRAGPLRGALALGALLLCSTGCSPELSGRHAATPSASALASGAARTSVAPGSSAGATPASRSSSGAAAGSSAIDLVRQDWQHVAGVSAAPDGLHVEATGFRIVRQDGTGGQPNPPVNLAGTHLAVSGGFAVTATIASATGDATLALYDRPPVIADEFRIEPAGIRLTVRGADLEVAVFDGTRTGDPTSPRPVYDQHVALADPAAPLTVTRSGTRLTVRSGGTDVAATGTGRVFSSGGVWLGLSSDAGSFVVASLSASGVGGGTVTAVAPGQAAVAASPGLQAAASRVRPGFLVGAAVALGPLVSDPAYASEVVSNVGSVTPENAMKAQFISPRQGVYDFAEADAVVAFAQAHGLVVHGHTLAFSEAEPAWMRDLPHATEAQRQASAAVLLDYVRTVVTHFKGRLASLDVVNEPLDPDQGTALQPNIWSEVFGPSYPVVVSQAVHEADPDVAQYVNENGAEAAGDRQDALLALIRSTNAQGGHISGVGLQAHVYDLGTDAISAADLTRTFDRFGAAGLRVRISENDVVDDAGTAAQAAQYAAVFSACLADANCVGWTTWGVDDRYDWFVDDDGSLQQGHDLLFDGGRPTAAYTAVTAAAR